MIGDEMIVVETEENKETIKHLCIWYGPTVTVLTRCKDCVYFRDTCGYGCAKFGTVVHNNPEWFCAEAEQDILFEEVEEEENKNED